MRYLEICRFYVDFNHSFGQGLRSIDAINLIFERNRDFIIINRPAKFHENRLRTFWVNRVTDRHTHRQIHADENNTSPKTKFLGEVIRKWIPWRKKTLIQWWLLELLEYSFSSACWSLLKNNFFYMLLFYVFIDVTCSMHAVPSVFL